MIKFGIFLLALCAFTGANKPYRPRFDGRIVGGRQVDIKDFPYQLSLQYLSSHLCGGSIISANWVLTASHCVDGVIAGLLSIRAGSSIHGSGGIIHHAIKIIMHPKYDTMDWDYALVKVGTPFELGTPGIAAINLADTEPIANTNTTVSGWGTTSSGGSLANHLMAVDVHIVNRSDCDNAYGSITDRMICASDVGKDSCQGDSGGPLVNDETGELVGIVSWGKGCAEKGYPGVYSNVAAARDWIKQNSGV